MDSRPGDETLLLAVAERDMGAYRPRGVRGGHRCLDRRPKAAPD
jgi:hypothetical protein